MEFVRSIPVEIDFLGIGGTREKLQEIDFLGIGDLKETDFLHDSAREESYDHGSSSGSSSAVESKQVNKERINQRIASEHRHRLDRILARIRPSPSGDFRPSPGNFELVRQALSCEVFECPFNDCQSTNTAFEYFNNRIRGKTFQPRYKCKTCLEQWTLGGAVQERKLNKERDSTEIKHYECNLCGSGNTRIDHYINMNIDQPMYFCRDCKGVFSPVRVSTVYNRQRGGAPVSLDLKL